MIKRCVLVVLLFVLCTTDVLLAQATWKMLLPADVYSVVLNPKNQKTIFAGGSARRVYRSFDAGSTWDTLAIDFIGASEELSQVMIPPNDTSLLVVGGIRFGTIRRSTNSGETWENVLSGGNYSFSGESIIYNPHNPNELYAAAFSQRILFRSRNRARTWDSIGTLPNKVCAITFRSDSANIIVAGCTGGTICISNDTGKTWKTTYQLVQTKYTDTEVPQIVFSKNNPRIGYSVAMYFFSPLVPNGGLHKTEDGGYSWKLVACADTALWAVATRNLLGNDELFVGGFTEHTLGDSIVPGAKIIQRSTNSGDTWQPIGDACPWNGSRANVWSLRYSEPNTSNAKLFAATEAGLYVLENITDSTITPYTPLPLIVSETSPNVFSVQYSPQEVQTSQPVVQLFNSNGQLVQDIYLQPYGAKSYFKTVSLQHLASGMYHLVITHRTESYTQKVVVVH